MEPSNAFTSAFKELDPIPQFRATARLGRFWKLRIQSSCAQRLRPLERTDPETKVRSARWTLLGIILSVRQQEGHSRCWCDGDFATGISDIFDSQSRGRSPGGFLSQYGRYYSQVLSAQISTGRQPFLTRHNPVFLFSDMSSAPSTLETPFEDADWELLIGDIERHNFVPVIGPDLLIKGADPSWNLDAHLVQTLAQKFRIDPTQLPPNCPLLELCSYVDPRARASDIRKAVQATNWPLPEPLTQLAAISGFDLYVSTTFDTLLYDAVNQARAGAEARIYGLKRPHMEADISSDRLRAPIVFQIFGQLDGTADCALSDEEMLQFTQRLQDPAYRPPRIFDLLARRNLLFLGCGYPGWLGRFFRRVLKVSGELRDQGLFAYPPSSPDHGYVHFLKRQSGRLWLHDSGIQFVAELHRRWLAKHPAGECALVFISYARQDEPDARDLAELFQKAGIPVWFDRTDLRSGETWNQEIEKAIQASRVFIPLISRRSDRTVRERFVHREWDLARNMTGKLVCPLRMDFTPTPREFAQFHTRTVEERQDLVRDVVEFLAGPE